MISNGLLKYFTINYILNFLYKILNKKYIWDIYNNNKTKSENFMTSRVQ